MQAHSTHKHWSYLPTFSLHSCDGLLSMSTDQNYWSRSPTRRFPSRHAHSNTPELTGLTRRSRSLADSLALPPTHSEVESVGSHASSLLGVNLDFHNAFVSLRHRLLAKRFNARGSASTPPQGLNARDQSPPQAHRQPQVGRIARRVKAPTFSRNLSVHTGTDPPPPVTTAPVSIGHSWPSTPSPSPHGSPRQTAGAIQNARSLQISFALIDTVVKQVSVLLDNLDVWEESWESKAERLGWDPAWLNLATAEWLPTPLTETHAQRTSFGNVTTVH